MDMSYLVLLSVINLVSLHITKQLTQTYIFVLIKTLRNVWIVQFLTISPFLIMINYINFNQERKHGCYMYQRNIKINPVCMIKDQSAMYGSSQLPLSLTILCMIVSKYEHMYIGLFKHLILLINIGVYIIFFLKILPLLSLANRQWV